MWTNQTRMKMGTNLLIGKQNLSPRNGCKTIVRYFFLYIRNIFNIEITVWICLDFISYALLIDHSLTVQIIQQSCLSKPQRPEQCSFFCHSKKSRVVLLFSKYALNLHATHFKQMCGYNCRCWCRFFSNSSS